VHVALVQTASGLDPADNRRRLDALTPHEPADLVVFPEAFARDFGPPGSSVAAYAEPLDGPFVAELTRVAADRGTTLVAGMFEPSGDPERPYNTLVVRGAAEASYRKIHLYDSFGFRESDQLAAGPVAPVTFPLAGFTVGLLTCYDLRFPELARALVDKGADVLVVPSAWVAGRHKVDHWLTLARSRAIENVAYVVAVGQCGPRYTGHSVVVDPYGQIVAQAEADDVVLHADLDPTVVREARGANPSLANRRM
jgi:deaminated glutathione amidase